MTLSIISIQMHQKVFKCLAIVCSTACLYLFIAFSSHSRSYQKAFLYDYNKYAKQVFVSSEAELLTANDKCCEQSTADTIPIDQRVSSLRVSNDKLFVTNSDTKSHQFIQLNHSDKHLHQNSSEIVEEYRKYCDFHIAMIFSITQTNNSSNDNKLNNNKSIDKKLYRSLTSILKYMNQKRQQICVHLITDKISQIRAKPILKDIKEKSLDTNGLRFYFEDINKLNALINYLLPTLKSHFSYKPNSYYSHSLFFTSLVFHKYFTSIERLIFLDIDVQFSENISELNKEFLKFSSNALIGIAFEQQPVYRHILHDYRRKIDNQTRLGSPPPNGWPGFNSGVLLMNLKRMRESNEFNSLLNSESIDSICRKYFFSGHLGDQDFYTVVSFEFKHLFHVIACNWNRQLCQWWRYHGYRDVFDSYFRCDNKIKLFHGNCNSVLPSVI